MTQREIPDETWQERYKAASDKHTPRNASRVAHASMLDDIQARQIQQGEDIAAIREMLAKVPVDKTADNSGLVAEAPLSPIGSPGEAVIEAARDVGRWRKTTIETPLDDRFVLGISVEWDANNPEAGTESHYITRYKFGVWENEEGQSMGITPSHWMPLPIAPDPPRYDGASLLTNEQKAAEIVKKTRQARGQHYSDVCLNGDDLRARISAALDVAALSPPGPSEALAALDKGEGRGG